MLVGTIFFFFSVYFIDYDPRYKDCNNIHTKIVGVTFKNDDGSSRQNYLCRLRNREELFLKEYIYEESPAFHVCNKIVFVEEVDRFDRNKLYDREREEEDYIYYCKIVIYFKSKPLIN